MAWHALGWSPVAFSEIEKFPSQVLAHHYGSNMPGEPDALNGVPNHGDMTKFEEWPDHAIDLLVGGTPCQSFSQAGLRKGLADPRGNLMLTYLAIARRYQPRWLVWENVPGVFSVDGGEAFASLIGGMAELGYHAAWRVLDAQYVRVDGHERAVPQRRKRVFVVGYLGDWQRASAALFDAESMSGNSPPRREAGQGTAPTLSARTKGGGGLGTDFDLDGGLISSTGSVAHCLNAGSMGRIDYESETMIAHSLKGEGFDASEDGTGRGTPLVPVAPTLRAGGNRTGGDRPYGTDVDTCDSLLPIAFSSKDYGADAVEGVAPTLRAMGHADSHPNAGGQVAIAIQERAVSENPDAGPQGKGWQEDVGYTLEARHHAQAVCFNPKMGGHPTMGKGYTDDGSTYTLDTDCNSVAVAFDMRGREGGAQFEGPHETANVRAASGGSSRSYVAEQWAVRRLTAKECERLQGFPDNFTNIPWRGKGFAPDDPRYKALGNSMAVNVMRWIGQRIDHVEAFDEALEAAE